MRIYVFTFTVSYLFFFSYSFMFCIRSVNPNCQLSPEAKRKICWKSIDYLLFLLQNLKENRKKVNTRSCRIRNMKMVKEVDSDGGNSDNDSNDNNNSSDKLISLQKNKSKNKRVVCCHSTISRKSWSTSLSASVVVYIVRMKTEPKKGKKETKRRISTASTFMGFKNS